MFQVNKSKNVFSAYDLRLYLNINEKHCFKNIKLML